MRISQFLGVVYSPDWANHVGGAGDAVDTRFGTKAAGSSDRSREPERSTCSRAACTSALLRRAVRGGERSLLRVRHPPEEREVRMREPARVPRRGSRRHRTPEARRGSAAPGLHRTGAEPRGVARADRADGLRLGQRLAEDDGPDTDGLQVPFEDFGCAARSGERDLCVEDGCGGTQPAVLAAVEWGGVTTPVALASKGRFTQTSGAAYLAYRLPGTADVSRARHQPGTRERRRGTPESEPASRHDVTRIALIVPEEYAPTRRVPWRGGSPSSLLLVEGIARPHRSPLTETVPCRA